MKAQIITRFKEVAPDGSLVEMVVWHVPELVPPSEHAYKYRLVYVVDGVRVVGFDNERGKGDHRHIDGREIPYCFVDADQLIDDFFREVVRWHSEH